MPDTRDQEVLTMLFGVLEQLGTDREPLERVDDIPRLESFVDEASHAIVSDARSAGASWADIADRLGVSRQAAHKRFTSRDRTRIELRIERRKQ